MADTHTVLRKTLQATLQKAKSTLSFKEMEADLPTAHLAQPVDHRARHPLRLCHQPFKIKPAPWSHLPLLPKPSRDKGWPNHVQQRQDGFRICRLLHNRPKFHPRVPNAESHPALGHSMWHSGQSQAIPIHGTGIYSNVFCNLWTIWRLHHVPRTIVVF